MSNHEAAAVDQDQRRTYGTRLRARRAVVAGTALLLGLGGLTACGDDDDASETVPGQTDEAVESSAPAADATTTTASTTTTPATTTTARPTTTAAESAATSEPAVVEETAPPATEAATAATDVATTAGTETTAAAETAATSVDSSIPTGSELAGTVPGSSEPITTVGPTTTGPECEYTENDEFPLERCDAGPAIAAVQSVLQAREYEIGTVDCLFGDQTHYAVRAFQTDEELTVTGAVDEETWAALDILDDWGTDTNGNGSIEPDEITLICA
jgi:peptidoglycan hydrolase-like protein with peptidoglycan-binding domain